MTTHEFFGNYNCDHCQCGMAGECHLQCKDDAFTLLSEGSNMTKNIDTLREELRQLNAMSAAHYDYNGDILSQQREDMRDALREAIRFHIVHQIALHGLQSPIKGIDETYMLLDNYLLVVSQFTANHGYKYLMTIDIADIEQFEILDHAYDGTDETRNHETRKVIYINGMMIDIMG